MLNIVIFGGPGSGKGTQSALIAEKFGLEHLSTGDLLRAEMTAGTELGKVVQSYISQGNLVPDKWIIIILSKTIDSLKDKNGVIFDGFPRTIAQAEALDEILGSRKKSIAMLLDLQVTDEVLQQRMMFRSKTSGRSDDNPETIMKRIDVYHEITAPVIEYYKNKGLYQPIPGTGTVEGTFAEISRCISNYK